MNHQSDFDVSFGYRVNFKVYLDLTGGLQNLFNIKTTVPLDVAKAFSFVLKREAKINDQLKSPWG